MKNLNLLSQRPFMYLRKYVREGCNRSDRGNYEKILKNELMNDVEIIANTFKMAKPQNNSEVAPI